MILDEQKHKNLYRRYYQGRIKDYDSSKAIFKGWSYLTTQPIYAYFYAKDGGNVSEFVLKTDIDVFNANCDTDFYKLKQYAIENDVAWLNYDIIERLKTEDWSYVLKGDTKRSEILDILKNLGYDGFFNYEYSDKMQKELSSVLGTEVLLPNEPAIGVLDKTAFTLIGSYDNLGDLLTLDKAKEYKEQEKAGILKTASGLLKIKKHAGLSDEQIKEICVNTKTLTLTKSELEKAIDELIDDFNKPSDLLMKIQEELEKYGQTLDTYNGVRVFKNGLHETQGKQV